MRNRYTGVCYDGPWEGREIVHDAPWYRIAVYPPMRVVDFNSTAAVIPETIPTHEYIWSRSLKKWCFRQCQ